MLREQSQAGLCSRIRQVLSGRDVFSAPDGTGFGAGLTLAWPGGMVTCPGDIPLKPDGWCEFTATEGEFTLTLAGRGQPVTIVLPQNDQHTVATAVFRRLW